jgi:hypothetical protein
VSLESQVSVVFGRSLHAEGSVGPSAKGTPTLLLGLLRVRPERGEAEGLYLYVEQGEGRLRTAKGGRGLTAARLKGGFGVLAPGANLHVITNPWTKRQMPGTGVRRGYGERLSFTLDFTQCRTATVHGPYIMSQCDVLYEDTAARPSEPTPRGAAPRRRSPPRSHRRIRLLTAARLTAAARPTRRNCAAASASLENERAARATVRSRAQRRRAKPAGRSSA